MGVVEYSKRQLKTVGFPFENHWSKPHPSDCAHLLQHTSRTAQLHYAGYCHQCCHSVVTEK